MREVREWTAHARRILHKRRDPVVVQTLRSAFAATIAYVIALRLSPEPAPLTAPLTALLVVQVTLYATLTNGFRRVNAVVTGVLVAIAFSLLVGLTWWSLALLLVASLAVGRLVRVEEYVPEVAISAMLVLGVTTVGDTAWARVVETLIGAVVGLGCNLLLAPPVWVEEAGESIEGLARRLRQLMLRMGEEAAGGTPPDQAVERLHEARRLDHDIVEVDAALRQAEDSLRLNPRVREACCTGWCCAPAWTRWRSARSSCACSRAPSPTSRRSASRSRCSIPRRVPRWSSCCPRSPTPW
ncbi:hypothetical protein STAFG_3167 [Streptomyces afghaniensis 772]|uniref:Integral membrane bound transporter domain-containing protein n=1 Tax=Streptomyces afghaniensis 772 TaxID=1283301 RepID=S4MSZ4_9ACTN|nr:hypothetical protein STAFG_3167 [Streptomyces afghaniensis 772]